MGRSHPLTPVGARRRCHHTWLTPPLYDRTQVCTVHGPRSTARTRMCMSACARDLTPTRWSRSHPTPRPRRSPCPRTCVRGQTDTMNHAGVGPGVHSSPGKACLAVVDHVCSPPCGAAPSCTHRRVVRTYARLPSSFIGSWRPPSTALSPPLGPAPPRSRPPPPPPPACDDLPPLPPAPWVTFLFLNCDSAPR